MGDHIIGPIYIEENLTTENNLHMLRDDVIPFLACLFQSVVDRRLLDENVCFQQVGATPHYGLNVRI